MRYVRVACRWGIAVAGAAGLIFAASALAQGWLVFRSHDADFSYLNKRLDVHVLFTMPAVTGYFLLVYAAFSRGRARADAPTGLDAACKMGALAGFVPALGLAALGLPIVGMLAVGLGIGVLSLIHIIVRDDVTGDDRSSRNRLAVCALLAACGGAIFTTWVMGTALWRDLDVDYFVARQGIRAYLWIAPTVAMWFAASFGTIMGVLWLAILGHRTLSSLPIWQISRTRR